MPAVTVGDLVGAYQSDQAKIDSDQSSIATLTANLAAAQAGLVTDQGLLATATQALGAALAQTGGVFTTNADGTITAYEPDGQGGVATRLLKPAGSTPAPAAAK